MGVGVRSAAPYVDVELDVAAVDSSLPLVRSVAAEIALRAGAGPDYAARVRAVAGSLASALFAVADPGAPMHCVYRALDAEVSLRMRVRAYATSSESARQGYARIIDELVESTSTLTRPGPSGGFEIVSDSVVPLCA